MRCYLKNSLRSLENVWKWILSMILEKILQNLSLGENVDIQSLFCFCTFTRISSFPSLSKDSGHSISLLTSPIEKWAWMDNWHLTGRNYSFPSAFSSDSQHNLSWIQHWITPKVICLTKVGCFHILRSAWVHLPNLQILKLTPTENDCGTLIRMPALCSEIGSLSWPVSVFSFSRHWPQE